MRAAASALLMMVMVWPAHAATVWCSLEDASQGVGFVTELRREAATTPQDLRKLAARFRRNVNEAFGTSFNGGGAACRRFPNHPKAVSGLASLEADWQRRVFRITTVGVF